MGNVLRKLAFQSCLVIFAVLQTGIKTYDVPGNVSQFIVGKMDVCVTYVLIFFSHVCENAQLSDIQLETPHVEIVYEEQQDRHCQCHQEVAVVGCQHCGQRDVVNVRSPDYQTLFRKRSRRIEPFAAHGAGRTLDVVSFAVFYGLLNFLSVQMVVQMLGIRRLAVIEHFAVHIHERDAHALIIQPSSIPGKRCGVGSPQVADVAVIPLQSGVQDFNAVLFLPLVLEKYEQERERQEQRRHDQEKSRTQ